MNIRQLPVFVLGATAMLVACGTPDSNAPADMSSQSDDAVATVALSAVAKLMNAGGEAVGEAVLTETADGLTLALTVTGLTEGHKGVHIHQTGACTAPDFTSAGSHWNPMATQHGLDNPQGAHKGDLPNLEVGADGTGALTAQIDGATLAGESGLFDDDGAAFVVHERADDQKTDPSGDSGARIACGVFAQG